MPLTPATHHNAHLGVKAAAKGQAKAGQKVAANEAVAGSGAPQTTALQPPWHRKVPHQWRLPRSVCRRVPMTTRRPTATSAKPRLQLTQRPLPLGVLRPPATARQRPPPTKPPTRPRWPKRIWPLRTFWQTTASRARPARNAAGTAMAEIVANGVGPMDGRTRKPKKPVHRRSARSQLLMLTQQKPPLQLRSQILKKMCLQHLRRKRNQLPHQEQL